MLYQVILKNFPAPMRTIFNKYGTLSYSIQYCCEYTSLFNSDSDWKVSIYQLDLPFFFQGILHKIFSWYISWFHFEQLLILFFIYYNIVCETSFIIYHWYKKTVVVIFFLTSTLFKYHIFQKKKKKKNILTLFQSMF